MRGEGVEQFHCCHMSLDCVPCGTRLLPSLSIIFSLFSTLPSPSHTYYLLSMIDSPFSFRDTSYLITKDRI